ncbi:MAG: hypothetical protein J6C50_02510 [Rickettsiales bacterium]|nr:hypothetical protein [Rickettsiales bacterium]
MDYNIPAPPPLPSNMIVESKTDANITNKINNNTSGDNTTNEKIRIRRSNLEEAKRLFGLPEDAFEFMTVEEEIEADIKSFNAMIEFERRSSNWW